MISPYRFAFSTLIVSCALLSIGARAEAGPIQLRAWVMVVGPAYFDPGGATVTLTMLIAIDQDWYFQELSVSHLATENGDKIMWGAWPYGYNREFGDPYLRQSQAYGDAISFGSVYATAGVAANAAPGLYDRDFWNPQSPATVSVRATNKKGETVTETVRISHTVQRESQAIPEPGSVLLLATGLVAPVGLAWLRRRRAA